MKSFGSRDLGISPEYLNMIKNRKRRISDELLEKLLEKLTAKDLLEFATATNMIRGWWARGDLNPGPPPRQGGVLPD